MTELAVRFTGVCKRYPQFELSEVDLELPRGQVLGLIGPNGAGKSTSLRILMGLVHQDRGEVEVLGHRMPVEQIDAKWQVGFASSDLGLYRQTTLAWHLDFVRSIFPSWDPAYAEQLLRRFDLRPEHRVKGLSQGQRVMAGLLLVLARRPQLLVLDEPTTGLDPVARREVLAALAEALADEERTIVFSSHHTADVEQLSDRITFIDRGRIVSSEDKETFLDVWRRLRLEIPPETELPREAAGVVDLQRSGRLAVMTTDRFSPELLETCRSWGATVRDVEAMSLEEIFVASVERSRRLAGDRTDRRQEVAA